MDGHHSFGLSTSSPSTGDVESLSGTPDTKLTTFSPEDVRGGSKVMANSGIKVNLPPAFALQGVPSRTCLNGRVFKATIMAPDPFTSTSNVAPFNRMANDGLKLSPTAVSFTPLSAASHYSSIDGFNPSRQANSGSGLINTTSSVGYLTATSVPDTSPTNSKLKKNLLSVSAEPLISPIGQRTPSLPISPTTSEDSIKSGNFWDLGEGSRYLMISQVSSTTSPNELNDFFNARTFPSFKHVVVTDLVSLGIVYVRFADLRDANMAYSNVQTSYADWRVQYIGAKQFVANCQPEQLLYTSDYEGQVFLTTTYSGPLQRFDAGCIGHVVKELLENYGDLVAFQLCYTAPPSVAFQAEFCSTDSADCAVASLDSFKIASCFVSITHYSPDVANALRQREKHPGPFIIGSENAELDHALGHMSLNGARRSRDFSVPASKFMLSHTRPSPTGSTFTTCKDLEEYQNPSPTGQFSSGHPGNGHFKGVSKSLYCEPFPMYGVQMLPWAVYGLGAVGQERVGPGFPGNRRGPIFQQRRGPPRVGARQSHDYSSTHHNVVDVERIRQGLDVRTTIMLRNIPNKIDQGMLKGIVDETSHGKYDFMYLRIDFANNCNVGYAFINFEDPWFIIDFVNARAGHRWNRYNSDKVAELSYATIQGKDCLVQKFRNSSVMLEHPSFRPKIFHTGTGLLAGQEDKFPGPDNPSKMRRSIENAEHVGLFAPRAGQHFRDEQRRRRSQYDRGTRLAELEDAYDNEGHERYGRFNHRQIGGPYTSYAKYTRGQHRR